MQVQDVTMSRVWASSHRLERVADDDDTRTASTAGRRRTAGRAAAAAPTARVRCPVPSGRRSRVRPDPAAAYSSRTDRAATLSAAAAASERERPSEHSRRDAVATSAATGRRRAVAARGTRAAATTAVCSTAGAASEALPGRAGASRHLRAASARPSGLPSAYVRRATTAANGSCSEYRRVSSVAARSTRSRRLRQRRWWPACAYDDGISAYRHSNVVKQQAARSTAASVPVPTAAATCDDEILHLVCARAFRCPERLNLERLRRTHRREHVNAEQDARNLLVEHVVTTDGGNRHEPARQNTPTQEQAHGSST